MSKNKLPASKTAIRKVETLVERYILLDSLLFKIKPEKESTVLTVPETCTDKVIMLYHSSLFKGHQGVIKTYLTKLLVKIFSYQILYTILGPV